MYWNYKNLRVILTSLDPSMQITDVHFTITVSGLFVKYKMITEQVITFNIIVSDLKLF